MAITLTQFKQLGREWIEQFDTIEFAGEIDVTEDELEHICSTAGRHLGHAWDEEYRAALTVAVINIAYHATSDVHNSFRRHVLSRLGFDESDTNKWDREIGPAVLRVLKKYFSEEELPGPYRYVTPVMRQAGVPARSVERFASFLRQLTATHGWQISLEDYQSFCRNNPVLSPSLANFLNSSAGWRYSCDVARVLKNRFDGITADGLSHTLPGFRGHAFGQLWNSFDAESPIAVLPNALQKPKLILDRINLQLAISFSEKGLNGEYKWENGERVRAALYSLRQDDFEGGRCGSIQRPDGTREPWKIDPWRPAPNSWAIFHGVSGSILQCSEPGAESIRPGRYLLAIPQEFYSRLSDHDGFIEYEDCGELFVPGGDDLMLRVFDCQLPEGCNVPELNLRAVGRGLGATPSLYFADGGCRLPFTNNVFVGRLPPVRINNLPADFADRYFIALSGDSRTRILSLERGPDDCLQLPVQIPSQGVISIQPKGRTPKGFEGSELPYVLLPADVQIKCPTGLSEPYEQLKIRCHPAEKFSIEWQPKGVTQNGAGDWQVPARVEALDGQITYDKTLTFPLSLRFPRLYFESDIIRDNILWSDKLRERSQMRVTLSKHEAGRHVELGLIGGDGFSPVTHIGPLHRNSEVLLFSTEAIRDAFDNCLLPAGRLSVRLLSSKIISSEVIFLREGEIENRLLKDDNTEFNSWIECVPAELRESLNAAREMRNARALIPLPRLVLPTRLLKLFELLNAYSRAFDVHETAPSASEASASSSYILPAWLISARAYLDSLSTQSPAEARILLLAFRSLRLSRDRSKVVEGTDVLFPRWRVYLTQTLRKLRRARQTSYLKRSVREWSNHCCHERWQSAKSCLIGQTVGGATLTDAACNYFDAIERKTLGHHVEARNFLAGARNELDKAREESLSGLVWEIATALRVMVFYHFDHDQMCETAAEASTVLGDQWNNFKKFLSLLCGVESSYAEVEEALALADFSPHPKDTEIEGIILNGR